MERPDPQPVPDALALSERLLGEAEAGAPVLVVHRVAPAAITVGRAQRGDVDLAAASAEGLEVVLRPSAGDGRRGHAVHHECRTLTPGQHAQ